MDFFIPIFILFTVFVLCSLCGFCCKKQNEGAIFSTPVVITSQTHQPVGARQAYPVYNPGPGVVHSSYQTSIAQPAMPMPYTDATAPYPTGPQANYPMPGGAPYPQYPPAAASPYPPQAAPYPPQAASPYPPQAAPYPPQHDMNPPTYNDVVGNQTYQKQAPYNPGYSG